MLGRAYFVTGTDTGVGKTWVSARLVEGWQANGYQVAALKAAESGCRLGERGLVGEDDELLFVAAGGWQPERCLFKFEPAVAPGVAAEAVGVAIDLEVIAGQVERLRAAAARTLVEGAGGWLVPLGGGATIETLAVRLGLPVIVVGRAGLGTINHVALTVRAIQMAGCQLAAVLLSLRPDDDATFAIENAREIERITGARTSLVRSVDDARSAIASHDL